MRTNRWMRTGLALLLALVAWFTLCAGKGVAQDKPALTWYGYVKLDASWDQGLVNAGNYARWVVSDDVIDGHGHFNMTARQTRLGFTAVSKAGGGADSEVPSLQGLAGLTLPMAGRPMGVASTGTGETRTSTVSSGRRVADGG